MKKGIIVLLFVLGCIWGWRLDVHAQETEEEDYQEYLELMFGNYDMSAIDQAMAGYYPDMEYRGADLMRLLMQGQVRTVMQTIWEQLCYKIWENFLLQDRYSFIFW